MTKQSMILLGQQPGNSPATPVPMGRPRAPSSKIDITAVFWKQAHTEHPNPTGWLPRRNPVWRVGCLALLVQISRYKEREKGRGEDINHQVRPEVQPPWAQGEGFSDPSRTVEGARAEENREKATRKARKGERHARRCPPERRGGEGRGDEHLQSRAVRRATPARQKSRDRDMHTLSEK